MKVLERIPSNFPAVIMLLLLLFSPWCAAYSSSDQPETYVARNAQVNDKPQTTLSLLSALQAEDSTHHILIDSTASSTASVKKTKDPIKAFAFAVFPGFVLHGSGHFYAGKYGTAAILFGSEVLTFALGAVAAIGRSEESEGSDPFTAEVWAVTLLLGSWMYDVVGAPLAVQKHNKKLLDNKNVGIQLHFKDEKPTLALVWRF